MLKKSLNLSTVLALFVAAVLVILPGCSNTISPVTLVSVGVTPTTPAVTDGGTVQFAAQGNYSDDSFVNITSTVTWTSSDPTIATISAGGLATSVAAGTVTITATSASGVSGTATLTVNPVPPTLVSIAVTPATALIDPAGTEQFTATGTYSDGSTQDLTATATWTSSDTTIATIAAGGLATGVADGTVTISAASGGVTPGTATLTVGPPVLVSIAVTPGSVDIAVAATEQFTATGTYSDGSTQDLTTLATWTSSNTGVATIAAGGLATGVANGSTTISAAYGTVPAGTATLEVGPFLQSITLTPANPSITVGGTQQFTATGNYSDGSHQNLTNVATWRSVTTSVATIVPGGLATGVADGTSQILATDGNISGSTILTVTGP